MLKPYYQDDWATIYHGDCRDVLPMLEPVDLVLTDPPYGINYAHSGDGRGKHSRRNVERITGDNDPFDPSFLLSHPNVIMWGADHYAQRLPEGRWLVWDKLNGLDSFDTFSDVEIAWHSKKGASRIFRLLWKGILQGEKEFGVGKRWHPTQKPISLMAWCIKQAGAVSSLCDPFMGSGTTLRAAKNMGIKSTGIEIEERYCQIAVERLRQESLLGLIERR
jgi:site-specific DNA-methyltransferase (adenine-specific)/modification methylase